MAAELVVDIKEGRTLVVRHVFFGRTRDRAIAILKAHAKADRFLRDCLTKRVYAGSVPCRARVYWGR